MARRRLVLRIAALLPGLLLATPAHRANGGTCTVVPGGIAITALVPSAGSFVFPARDAGVALPIDVDAASGVVTIARGGIPELMADTPAGPVGLQMAGATVSGSIDASGNVSVPDFATTMVFAGIPLQTNPTLSTAIQSVTLNSVNFPSRGAALDFTTGLLTLAGADILANGPIAESQVIAGVVITCRLEPIPDRTTLPAAPTLKGVRGTTTNNLVLRATLVSRRPTIDLKVQDVTVRLSTAAGRDILALILKARSTASTGGKRARPSVTLQIAGKDPGAAPEGTKFAVRGNKRRAVISVRVPAIDLAPPPGNVVASVTIGPTVGAANVIAANGKITVAR